MSFRDFQVYRCTPLHQPTIKCTNCEGFRATEDENCILCGWGPSEDLPWNRAPLLDEEKAYALACIGVHGTKAEKIIDGKDWKPVRPNKELATKMVEIVRPVTQTKEQMDKDIKKLTKAQKIAEDVKKNGDARRRARGVD